MAVALDDTLDDVGLSETNFLKYYYKMPNERFYSENGFDPIAIILLERDLQDIYVKHYLGLTNKLPARQLSFRDPHFGLRNYCVTHDIPVVSADMGHDISPITSVGVMNALHDDLCAVVRLAEEDAAQYKLEHKKRRGKMGLRGYLGVCLCAVAGTAFSLWLAYGYIQKEVERRVADFRSEFSSAQSEVRSYFEVKRDKNGMPKLSAEMEQLATYFKEELRASTQQEIRSYFSVAYDAHGRPVFNDELENFFAAAKNRINNDFDGWIERFKTDDEFRRVAIESIVDALMDH